MTNNKVFGFDFVVFKNLLYAKLTDIRSTLVEKIINIYIWVGCTLFITGYLMQSFGLAENFGPFQFAVMFAGIGLFELYGNIATLVSDFEGDRIIMYYLTLPVSLITVLLSYICYYALVAVTISLALIPLGKIILWNQLNLASIAWGRFCIFLVLVNLVWATGTFLLSAHIHSIKKLGIAWTRIIFPLWFLGGFQFSWAALHAITPVLSYVMLLNPVIYATEGMRAVFLEQAGYLPFWICCTVLIVIWFVISSLGYRALKKRLDLI